MKRYFLFLTIVACVCLPVWAQTGGVSEVFQLGTKQVRIPSPEGFIDTATRYDRVFQRLYLTEDPGNENMASYVHRSQMPMLDKDQNIQLSFYAKLSVLRRAKAVDCSEQDFAQVVSGFKAMFPSFLDPDGKFQKDMHATINKNLEEVWGKETNLRVVGQKNLGYFQDGKTLFSGLMAMNVELDGKSIPLIASLSALLVNKRMIFLYVFKVSSSKEDANTMIDLTKKWTAAAVVANS